MPYVLDLCILTWHVPKAQDVPVADTIDASASRRIPGAVERSSAHVDEAHRLPLLPSPS